MAGVELDLQGRLLGFYATPPQREDDAAAGAPVDWSALFTQARLDAARFKPVPPRWTPPFHSDTRAAWVGTDAARPDLPLRLEAAAYRGKPVFFQMVWEWTRPERMEAARLRPGQSTASRVGVAIILVVDRHALLLARHNVRLGRGDRAGARRLAALALAGELCGWLLGAHHVAEIGGELIADHSRPRRLRPGGGGGVDPLPRHRAVHPAALAGHARLLDAAPGRPLEGSAGGARRAAGHGGGGAGHAGHPVRAGDRAALVRPAAAAAVRTSLDATLGLRYVLSGLVDITVGTLANAMLLVLILLVLRLVLRRDWLAAIAFMVTLSLQSSIQSPLPFAARPRPQHPGRRRSPVPGPAPGRAGRRWWRCS